ncbi:MAG: anthranilate phosphoribosyltransferase [Pseudomonadota bacterium]
MSVLKSHLSKIIAGDALSNAEMRDAMEILLRGDASDAEIGAFLVGMRTKGETIDEIAAAAETMRTMSVKVDAPANALDTCGTGGDGANTYNISTAVALVVAGCGVPVAKHGNKAATSQSGSSDVLSALGVKMAIEPEQVCRCIEGANVGFMFAALHHSAVANVAPARKAVGVRTMFNILGPLCNPARAKRQLMGVFDKTLLKPVASVMDRLGIQRAWVVHGSDGLDEITTTGPSFVASLDRGKIAEFTVAPSDAGISEASLEDLKGGSPTENAAAIEELLAGDRDAYRDIVLLNSAAALIVADKVNNLRDGVEMAAHAIDRGAAKASLDRLIEISNA